MRGDRELWWAGRQTDEYDMPSLQRHRREAMSDQWAADDLRAVFVAGAAWWEFAQYGATMWASDRASAEEEADSRYPGGKPKEKP